MSNNEQQSFDEEANRAYKAALAARSNPNASCSKVYTSAEGIYSDYPDITRAYHEGEEIHSYWTKYVEGGNNGDPWVRRKSETLTLYIGTAMSGQAKMVKVIDVDGVPETWVGCGLYFSSEEFGKQSCRLRDKDDLFLLYFFSQDPEELVNLRVDEFLPLIGGLLLTGLDNRLYFNHWLRACDRLNAMYHDDP